MTRRVRLPIESRIRYHAKKAGVAARIRLGRSIDCFYVDVFSEDPLDLNTVQNAISNGLGGDYFVTNPTNYGPFRRLHIGYCGDDPV